MKRLPAPLLAALALAALQPAGAHAQGAAEVARRYEKSEHLVPMRDGVRLHTAVYRPRDRSREWPILMLRTPYSCAPYGADAYRASLGPSAFTMDDGYVFVYQDVRGRFMSAGRYDNMRPHLPVKGGPRSVDESSDTRDTIDWLLANVEGHNGRVGMWGISYPGFYAAAALADAHPALVACSPQAPIADFWFDDFHHQGAYTLAYWRATATFGVQKRAPTTERWWETPELGTRDGYQFFLELGPLRSSEAWYADNFFWRQLVEHPNYDAFWQARNLLPHLKDVEPAVMTVGGWFDAEDLYGPLQIYRAIERSSPGAYNVLVMGPWSHGDWARNRGPQMVGDVHFGDGLSEAFQRDVEAPFFRRFLHGQGQLTQPEALVFDTGRKAWRGFDAWPPAEVTRQRFHLRCCERLSSAAPAAADEPFSEYVSDPAKPVPYTERTRVVFTPRAFMAEDQRFAARRPDVLVFQSAVLERDLTLAGDLRARLSVSTTGEDADWVVKLVDVYPPDEPDGPHTPPGVVLGNYQQLVRSEVLRGRWRRSFERPEPFVPGAVEPVEVPLQDVFHTFRAGHRVMVQVQSTWFPLIDRNPQAWVENVFLADEQDFVAATHRVHHAPGRESWLEVPLLPE